MKWHWCFEPFMVQCCLMKALHVLPYSRQYKCISNSILRNKTYSIFLSVKLMCKYLISYGYKTSQFQIDPYFISIATQIAIPKYRK